jgi:hypothetical protein
LTASEFVPGGIGTAIRRNTQNNTAQATKHNTQNYKNNKGHIVYPINTIIIQIQLQYKYNDNNKYRKGIIPCIM